MPAEVPVPIMLRCGQREGVARCLRSDRLARKLIQGDCASGRFLPFRVAWLHAPSSCAAARRRQCRWRCLLTGEHIDWSNHVSDVTPPNPLRQPLFPGRSHTRSAAHIACHRIGLLVVESARTARPPIHTLLCFGFILQRSSAPNFAPAVVFDQDRPSCAAATGCQRGEHLATRDLTLARARVHARVLVRTHKKRQTQSA
mmetsp:Transcript_58136/g.189398  ORF Transcript_58136/g.189398 Transcript_58136/m.189398 type:complete len:200 (+) Transcript_58136:1544-2143(+)